MSEEHMNRDDVWASFFGRHPAGAFFGSALNLLMLIPPEAFSEAVDRINRETTLGPLLRPSLYVDGRRFENARDYADVLAAAGRLRAVLERAGHPREPVGPPANQEVPK